MHAKTISNSRSAMFQRTPMVDGKTVHSTDEMLKITLIHSEKVFN